MAGDWIKMRGNLWDDPRIARLCDLTDQGEASIIGALYWLWASADQHTEDGFMAGLSCRQIDRKTGVQGFSDALIAVGWIKEEGEGVSVVNFDEHNGQSAKRRATEAKRKAGSRKASASGADKTGTQSGSDAELEKEEEKRREEKRRINIVFDHWVSVMRKDSKKTKLTDGRRKKIAARLKDYDVQDLLAAVDGCAASSFHMGDNNEGKRHNDIDLIFRNGEKLESFRDMKPARQPDPTPPKTGDQINPHGRY